MTKKNMKTGRIIMLMAVLSLMVVSIEFTSAQEQENKKAKVENKTTKTDTDGVGSILKKDQKLQLTVNKVIDYLLKNNLDVKAILLEYRGASTALEKYDSKYDTTLYGKADYNYSTTNNSGMAMLYGKQTKKATWSAGLSKKLPTGTTIEAGMTGYWSKVEGSMFGGASGNQTGFQVTLYQELLKNAFGTEDRLTEKKLANSTLKGRQLLKMQLSGLLTEALIAYWQIAIAEENLASAEISVKSAEEIRNLVAQKAKLGLSEPEDVADWNNKVLQLKNAREMAKQLVFDARLALLRTLNIETDMEIELGQTFTTDPPAVTEAAAVDDALKKRLDLEGLRIDIKSAELEYRIATQNVMPSLKLKASAGTLDYDKEDHFQTYNDLNEQYYAGLELSYPLGNTDAEVRLKEARLAFQKKQVAFASLEKVVKDEVASSVKGCETTFKVYEQSKQAHQYAKNYYFQVLAKFRMGRYSTFTVKQALDEYIKARYNELDSLVKYNVALLKRDNARNVIFDQFSIPVDDIMKQYEK